MVNATLLWVTLIAFIVIMVINLISDLFIKDRNVQRGWDLIGLGMWLVFFIVLYGYYKGVSK